MFIVKYKKIFLGISAFLTLGALFSILFFGIRLGLDFTGGSLLEVEYAKQNIGISATDASGNPITLGNAGEKGNVRPEVGQVKEALSKLGFTDAVVQPTGENGFIIRTKHLSEKEHTSILQALSLDGKQANETRFTSIGPVIGKELRAKAWASILAVILAIVLFITFAFRKVSAPVASSRYGIVAIVALVHDVIIPTGALALLGHFYGVEADVLFVTALLTILGFSIHDTIVVFDRIRENLKIKVSENFSEVVGISLRQTFVRSINTSLTVVLVLSMLLYAGPASTHNFSLILLVGIIAGTYSSIFLASPLLVMVEEMQKNKDGKRKK
jgi:preprotein translocase subunit SecF